MSQEGDVWILGDGHRLMCGSSTSPDDVAKLLGDEGADMVWTDPPYGVAYVGKTSEAMTIRNDALKPAELASELLLPAWT